MSKRKSRQQSLHNVVYHRAAWQCQMHTDYLVRLLPDGSWACALDCPAYSYGSRSDGECRHIDIAREEHERRMTLAFLLC